MSRELDFKRTLKTTKAWLHFEDGTSFQGWLNKKSDHPCLENGIWGEAAFTTGMSGYRETMTDPSFLGQHIIFTNSHIGNYESDERADQSEKSHSTCLIARNFSHNSFLEKTDVPLFSGLDTRALVKYMTSTKNSHKSVITTSEKGPGRSSFETERLICNDLEKVSQSNPQIVVEGENPIVLVNYGCKQSIVNNLKDMGLPLVVVPYNSKVQDIQKYNPRMIFLSNGPGDPRLMKEQFEEVRKFLELDIPMRGICLGHQLLTLALGGEIIKLPFGQRGVNHPCIDHVSGEILITSQNHGYAADEQSLIKIETNNILKRQLIIQSRSLFDQSVEGITTTDHHLKSVQFHPESNPGPSDAFVFFEEIRDFLNGNKHEDINTENLYPMLDVQQKIKKEIPYKKILLVGSGPIKIGQASEFDYSGTQAVNHLKSLELT